MTGLNNILYFDEKEKNLSVFKQLFSEHYNLHTSFILDDAIGILKKNEVKVLIVAESNSNISSSDFIKKVKELNPGIVCILVSRFRFKRNIYKSLNDSKLFWIVERRWNSVELKSIIDKALNEYNSEKEKQAISVELKQALMLAQKNNRLKSEFLNSISHEIRTPVNGIVGFTSIIKEATQGDEELNEYLEIIIESGFKLVGMVDDMIIASRINAEEMPVFHQEVYLNDLLDEIFIKFQSEQEKKPGIDFRVVKRKGEKKISITTDRHKLFNIFVQLLKNAFKFTVTGNIEFGIHNNDELIMYVKDTGTGISDSDKPGIFDFFTQGEHKLYSEGIEGIGIGLSIVKGLIKLLKGEIWFESDKGCGTTFYFKIPSETKKSESNYKFNKHQLN